MGTKIASDVLTELSKSPSAQTFLNTLLKARGAKAKLSRRAGFTSRSYLTELLNGKKGLSRDSLLRLKSSIKLPKPWPQFFEFLAWQSDPKLRPAHQTDLSVAETIKQLRYELKNRSIDSREKNSAANCIKSPQLFQVYAALGPPTVGATVLEIAARTKLAPRQITKYLNKLINAEAAVQRGDLFFAPISQADNLTIKNDLDLSEMVKLVTHDIHKNRDQILKEPHSLTIYSAFSVHRENLPQLKDKLQAAIFAVLDQFQDDQGDLVQQVFISLHQTPFSVNESLAV